MDSVDYSNFMTAFRSMARNIEKIIERLDKLIEMQGARLIAPVPMEATGEISSCPACNGTGFVRNTDPGSTSAIMVCLTCGGIGWK